MSEIDNSLASVLHQMSARISRLEITALAMTKAMADEGRLPIGFATTFKQDVEKHAASVTHQVFQKELAALGDQWSPLFEALAKDSANR